MAYTKQTWKSGDVVTSDKLNHMEDGIMESGGGSALIVNMTYDATNDCSTLDRTWQEIRDTAASGRLVYAKQNGEGLEDINIVAHIGESADENYYSVDLLGDISLSTSSPSGYPTNGSGGGGGGDIG